MKIGRFFEIRFRVLNTFLIVSIVLFVLLVVSSMLIVTTCATLSPEEGDELGFPSFVALRRMILSFRNVCTS